VASERIPAAASYLVGNAVPHVAEVIRRIRQESRQNWQSLLDQAFESSRATLCPERIRAILGGCCDDWTQEAYVSAVRLHNEAIVGAVQDRAVWDRRRTTRTRRRLLAKLADDHIRRWCADRGMDLAEAARLRDEGGGS
jgi:hypothetical protein